MITNRMKFTKKYLYKQYNYIKSPDSEVTNWEQHTQSSLIIRKGLYALCIRNSHFF